MDYEKMTTKELKQEAISFDTLINKLECYSTSDLRQFQAVLSELERRGVEIGSRIAFE
jgi:hypothetical protein